MELRRRRRSASHATITRKSRPYFRSNFAVNRVLSPLYLFREDWVRNAAMSVVKTKYGAAATPEITEDAMVKSDSRIVQSADFGHSTRRGMRIPDDREDATP